MLLRYAYELQLTTYVCLEVGERVLGIKNGSQIFSSNRCVSGSIFCGKEEHWTT